VQVHRTDREHQREPGKHGDIGQEREEMGAREGIPGEIREIGERGAHGKRQAPAISS